MENATKPTFQQRQDIVNPALRLTTAHYPNSTLSIVSYNILAECHRIRWDYSYTPEEYLSQDYRHELLVKELQYLAGDVVCLQEVNPDYFHSTLLPAMNRMGYDGLMESRTKKSYDEGEATFFKSDKLELESSKGVSLAKSAQHVIEKTDLSPAVKQAATDYLHQADVVLITRLRCKASDRVVTIGNVHIWWDDDQHSDVKAFQAACAVQEVIQMTDNKEAYVICGDFNSDSSNPVYQLMLDGHLSDSSTLSLKNIHCLQLENGSSTSLVDHFKNKFIHPATDLKSAYATCLGSEPDLTCYTDKGWMLDYIFYSSNTLVPLSVVGIVDTDIVVKTGGLPSQHFPSDHLSLKTLVAFI